MTCLAGYRHQRGVHCGSAALRNVFVHFTGRPMSEALCFGLGAGLGFTYYKAPGSSFLLTMGRGSYIENQFCNVLNVHLSAHHADDPQAGWEFLRACVDAGRLAMIDADMFHLPYMVQSLGLKEGVHFGGHKVLVVGHDGERVLLADYAWPQPQSVSLAELMRARGSQGCPSEPRNACYTFDFPDEIPDLGWAVRAALQTMVELMRHPFREFNGLPALERFCRQVTRWGRVYAGEELAQMTWLTAFMLEKAGTGGGNYRNLYSRFLKEAAELAGDPRLQQAADVYRELARHWREVASLLDESAEDPRRGMYIRGGQPQLLLDEIAALELRGLASIEECLQ